MAEQDPNRPAAPASDTEYTELSQNLRELALRLVRQQATADDVVQEAWLASLNERPDRIRDLNLWLRQVVRNLAARSHRKSRRQAEVESAGAQPEAVAGPEEPVARASLRELLHGSVSTLREPYRTVLTRRFLEEKNVGEIARELGHSPATVRSQVHRGLEELRRVLDAKHGGRREAWLPALALLAQKSEEGARRAAAFIPGALVEPALVVPALVAAGGVAVWLALSVPRTDERGPHVHEDAVTSVEAMRAADAAEGEPIPPATGEVPRTGAVTGGGNPGQPSRAEPLPSPDTRSLEVVVRRADGSPGRDAVVRVWGVGMKDLGTHEADESGSVKIEVLAADLMQPPLVAHPGGGVFVAAGEREEAWSLQYNVGLPPADAPRRIEVHTRGPAQELRVAVRDEDGEPIPHASVLVDGSKGGMFVADGAPLEERMLMRTTDERGELVLGGKVRRLYRLIVSAPEFTSSDRTYQAPGPVLEARVTLGRGSIAYGQVLGPDGPVAGARVWEQSWLRAQLTGEQHETLADEDGFFEHAGFGPGPHRLFARSPTDPTLFACEVVDVRPGEDLAWNPILTRQDPTVVLVLDEQGAPLEGAEVSLNNEDGQLPWVSDILATGPDGRVSFLHCPPGDLVAFTSRKANDAILSEDALHAGDELVVRLAADAPEASLTGVVATADGSAPRGATLFGVHEQDSFDVPVDPTTGVFSVQTLPAGEYRLSVVSEHGLVALGRWDLAPGASSDLGLLQLPDPVPISIEWPELAPSSGTPWSVTCAANWRERPLPIVTFDEPVPTLLLFEGSYWIGPADETRPGPLHRIEASSRTLDLGER